MDHPEPFPALGASRRDGSVRTGSPSGEAGGPRERERARSRWLTEHKWHLAIAAVAVSAASWPIGQYLLGPEIAAVAVTRGELIRTVVASGRVETPFRVEIGSRITGVVEDVLVEEGQIVVRGQQLVLLDGTELEAAVTQAAGAVAQGEARLRQIRETTLPAAQQTLIQARANLANAQAVQARAAQLAQRGHETQSSLDSAVRGLAIAQAQLRSAELQVQAAGAGGSEYVMAETELAQVRASLATARARLSYATIEAPRDGQLIARTVERGSVVQPGKALLVLAPSGKTQLVLQIDEKNLALLRPGQPALASADAYPDQRFAATLSFIGPSVDITRASVEVKLTVPAPPDYLRQDMTVSVDIEVDRRPDTDIVPARTVRDPASARPWVMVVRNGRAEAQPVRLGLRAADRVEILEGLSPGEPLLPLSAKVREGGRVRVAAP